VPTAQAPHANAKPDPYQDPHPHQDTHPDQEPDAHENPHHHPDWHAHVDGNVGDRSANGNGLAEFHRLEDLLTHFHRLEDLLTHFHRLEDLFAHFHRLEDRGNQLTDFERVEVTEPDRSSVAHDRPVGVARFPAERRGPGDAGSLVH
jgi:hypothetical protein